MHKAAFGGHVYAQSGLAVCRAWGKLEDQNGVKPSARLGLHTIHGYFTAMGIHDRPFVYDVTPMTTSRSLSTLSVTARQPSEPSSSPTGDHFPMPDASLPLSPPSYVAMLSFKLPEEHSVGISSQEDSPQQRFASILSSRKPEDWMASPPVDIDGMVSMVGAGHIGNFPIVDMKKVDMTAWNESRPVHERRELMLYRLLKPLPADGAGGWDANAHVLAHAYAADRNGLLMAGNNLGLGWSLGKAATISNSFVVHTNVDEAVMRGDGWWLQEMSFPRAGAGRGIVMVKIWSPEGVHVATEYQDGLIRSHESRPSRPESKL